MTLLTDLVAAAIKSAVDLNKPRSDAQGDSRVHGVIAVNALHSAVLGIASRLEAADPSFDSREFVAACGTVGAI